MACWRSANGVIAFDVVVILSSSPSCTSHAQPLPNWPAAASANFFLNARNEPNEASMRVISSSSAGSPPPLGVSDFQNMSWFQTWAALLKILAPAGANADSKITSSRLICSSGVPWTN